MIIYPTQREDGYYEFGDESNENLTIWAAYYHSSQSELTSSQITNDPAYHIEGIIIEGYIGVGSDSSKEELIMHLENEGLTIAS